MLPNAKNFPSTVPESSCDFKITSFVRFELLLPEFLVGGGHGAVLRAAVPEAPINENSQSLRAEHEIGLSEDFLIPTPARYVMPLEQCHERKLCLLVPGTANAGHDL